MPKVLFDQNISKHLRHLLPGNEIYTAEEMRWDVLVNGKLLRAAESEGFDLLLTADKKMYKQQKHLNRLISLLVIEPNRWDVVRQNAQAILDAIQRAYPGSHEELTLMEFGKPASAKARWSRR